MIIVHHLNELRLRRILWKLEELQVPYDIRSTGTTLHESGSGRASESAPAREVADINYDGGRLPNPAPSSTTSSAIIATGGFSPTVTVSPMTALSTG